MARSGRLDRGLLQNPRGKGWYVRIFFEGKEHRFGIYDTKSAARDCYETIKREQKEKRFDPAAYHKRKIGSLTLAQLIEDYISNYNGRSERNLKGYKKWWTRHLGKKRIIDIHPADLVKLQTRLLKRGLKAPGTINRRFAFLRHLYNLAIKQGRAENNPVTKVKFLKEVPNRLRFLTPEEELTLKERMTAEDFALVSFALNTGLRRSEQFRLKWSHIDSENRLLTIPLSKSGKPRHIPLNDRAMEILKGLNSWMVSQWVFPSQVPASPIDSQNFYNRVFIPALEGDETKKETKIEGVVWHTLRHTFASRLVMAGVDLRSVQELMGHQSIEMTMRYAHLSPDHLRSAVQKLMGKPEPAPSSSEKPKEEVEYQVEPKTT
jgi:site-specific recombinase XerD